VKLGVYGRRSGEVFGFVKRNARKMKKGLPILERRA
jgi:hypothetical protein